MIYQIMLLGKTERDAARIFEVSWQTVDKWKRERPEFLEALQRGRDEADMKVVDGFYQNCLDRYVDVEEVHFTRDGQEVRTWRKQFIQGDKWAQSRWLALRQREDWSEVHRVEVKQTSLNMELRADLSRFTVEELRVIRKIQETSTSTDTDAESITPNG